MLITPKRIAHRNYLAAKSEFLQLVMGCPGDLVILLVGGTRVGKSEIFSEVMRSCSATLSAPGPDLMPVVGFRIVTSKDGRVSQKFVSLKLLKELRHPMYRRYAAFDSEDRYQPKGSTDETTLRLAIDEGLSFRETSRIGIDELHHATHTGNEKLRADLLSSLKCIASPGRTFFGAGGYELLYRGAFDSAHFAGRLVIVDFPCYSTSAEDMEEWARVVKTFSEFLPLRSRSMLLDHSEYLLLATCGSVGLLEKHLWMAGTKARAGSTTMTWEDVKSALPGAKQRDVVLRDIEKGRKALERLPSALSENTKKRKSAAAKASGRPFETKPKRRRTGMPKVADE